MARPPRHDVASLLDAALRLAAEQGPQAVTVAAVAREAGAPSGSVYHRFSGRPALLAALWLRTLDAFQEGFLARLEDPSLTVREAVVAAARHVVAWSRSHPEQARVLRYGAADFGRASWPESERAALAAADERVARAVGRAAGRLAPGDPAAVRDRLVAAAVDIPYGIVQRHVRAGAPLPGQAEELVETCVRALLPDPVRDGATGP